METLNKISKLNSNGNEENLEQQIDRLNHLIAHLAGKYLFIVILSKFRI